MNGSTASCSQYTAVLLSVPKQQYHTRIRIIYTCKLIPGTWYLLGPKKPATIPGQGPAGCVSMKVGDALPTIDNLPLFMFISYDTYTLQAELLSISAPGTAVLLMNFASCTLLRFLLVDLLLVRN